MPLTPDEVVAPLTAKVDRPSPLYLLMPRLTTGAPFVGTVTGSGFNIRVRQQGRNSFAPHAVGVILATGTGSEIDATVGVGAAIRHALAVFIGLVGVLASPAKLSSGAPGATGGLRRRALRGYRCTGLESWRRGSRIPVEPGATTE